ncbi:hypothetical protein AOLI_G00143940 [Acnodon oligacanthus]
MDICKIKADYLRPCEGVHLAAGVPNSAQHLVFCDVSSDFLSRIHLKFELLRRFNRRSRQCVPALSVLFCRFWGPGLIRLH